MNSRTRRFTYIGLFNEIDAMRVAKLQNVWKLTQQEIDSEAPGETEDLVDAEMSRLEFLNDLTEFIVNAIEENEALDGN